MTPEELQTLKNRLYKVEPIENQIKYLTEKINFISKLCRRMVGHHVTDLVMSDNRRERIKQLILEELKERLAIEEKKLSEV
jgi:uncharacterized protein YjaG (DUF416 family)